MKKSKMVTKVSGAHKQLLALPGGGKCRSIPVAGLTIAQKPASSLPPTPAGTIPTGALTTVSGKPSQLAVSMGRIKPLRAQKQCCGKPVLKGTAKCPTCKTAFAQIPGSPVTTRSTRPWFSPILPRSQRKTFITSPRGATWPGSGVWLTPAQLSAKTAFMRVKGV